MSFLSWLAKSLKLCNDNIGSQLFCKHFCLVYSSVRCKEAWLDRCPKRCKNEMLLVFRDFDEGKISVLCFCMETERTLQLSTATVVFWGATLETTHTKKREEKWLLCFKGFEEKSMVVLLPGRASSQSTIHTHYIHRNSRSFFKLPHKKLSFDVYIQYQEKLH